MRPLAILGGFASFLVGSFIWIFIVYVLLLPILGHPTKMTTPPIYLWVINLLIAYIIMVRSGFLAGVQAKHNEYLHSIVVALLAILYSWVWRSRTPTWFWILYIIFMIPFALLGSQYAIKNNLKRYNQGVQGTPAGAGAPDA